MEQEFGNDGYATYFKCLEIVGKEGEEGRISFNKFPASLVSKKCNIQAEKLQKILEFMARIHLCCSKSFKRKMLYFPKFKERADNYTKYGKRYFEETSKKNGTEEKRREEIRKEEREKIQSLYFGLKNWNVKYITKTEWGGINKAIRELYEKVEGNVDLIEQLIRWVAVQGYIDWTLFTALKKLPEFMNGHYKPQEVREFVEGLK